MATKKDLVEAYSFSRRRLVTAFVSGAPGGREVEPARPGRMIVGGIALAVLLIAGAAVAGALTKRPKVDWDSPGLVTDDHGALYVILDKEQALGDPTLRPVINVTSAQLILGAGVKTKSVPDDVLARREKGPSIGILDAPPTVPAADRLLNTGWVACTANAMGIEAAVAPTTEVVATPDLGFVVEAADSGRRYLLAEASAPGHPDRAYSYELPARNDGLDADLGVATTDQIVVPDRWLTLFPSGGPLTADGLGFAGWGKTIQLDGYTAGARVGDYYRRAGDVFAVTRDGFVQLSEFASAVLRNTPMPGGSRPKEIKASGAGSPFRTAPTVPYDDALWPEAPVRDSAPATENVCGVLETAEGEQPAVRLATFPRGSRMLEDVGAGDRRATVEPGHGALVRSGDWGSATGGLIYLIDERSRSYSVAGGAEVENLGYGGVAPVVVPDSWTRLFTPGPDLSVLDALCPPRSPAPGEEKSSGPTCS